MRSLFIIFFILSGTFLMAVSKEDSLLLKLKTNRIDTQRFDIFVKLYAVCSRNSTYAKAKPYLDSMLAIAARTEDQKYKALAWQYRGNYFYKINRFDSAHYYDTKGIGVAEKLNYYPTLIRCYVNLGNISNLRADNQKAIVYLQKAEQYSLKARDTQGLIITTLNLGNIFYDINDYVLAKLNFRKTIVFCEKQPRFSSELASGYNNYATVCLNQIPKMPDSAMYFYNKYLELSIQLDNQPNIALAHYNIAEVYRIMGEVKKARENYFISMDMYKSEEDSLGIMKVCLGLGDNYILEKNYPEAVAILKTGLKLSYHFGMMNHTANFLKSISSACYQVGNYKDAFDYFQDGTILSDSIYNADNSRILYDMRTKYESDEKEKQNRLLEAENLISHKTIRQQQTVTYFIIGGLLLTIAFSFFIFRGLKQQRRANKIISEQKEEVHKQKEIIEEKQKEILDSIHYAKRIQNTLLTNRDVITSQFSDSFIFFRPKDIVSGDFYWTLQKEDSFYLAVCDSTGHGVPGAFMSLMNVNFINEAISEKNILEPHKVFTYVRDKLIESIGREGQKDGFDGILLRINKKNREITYAAANNAPVLLSNGTLVEMESDRMPVGKGERQADFVLYRPECKPGDILYLYTDGFADQFGGPKGKKFKYKALNDLLLASSSKTFEEQERSLEMAFDSWKGNLEQVDDVCIIGIRF